MNHELHKASEGEIIVQLALPAITNSAYCKGNTGSKPNFKGDYTKLLTENKIPEEVLVVLDPLSQTYQQSALL
jgi:hypothetical protein